MNFVIENVQLASTEKVAHLNVLAKMAPNVSRKPVNVFAKKVLIFAFCMKSSGVFVRGTEAHR